MRRAHHDDRQSIAPLSCLLLIAAGCLASGCAANGNRWWSRQAVSASPAVDSTTKPVPPKSPFQVASHPMATSDGEESANQSSTVPPALASYIGPRDALSTPSNFRDLTESEMLSLALANSPVLRPLGLRILDNPAAAATVYDAAISSSDPFFGPQAALAEFDSSLSASVNSKNNDRVFNNTTLGGEVQELVQDLATVNAGWQKRSFGGGIWEINSTHGYDNNNRSGNSFPNYWETQLEAGVRQPLLRGAGREFNLIAGPNARPGFNFSNGITIARLNDKISDADFEIQVRTFVRDLYNAYWDLVRQYRNYESVLAARDLSYDTWQSVLAKSRANLAGGEANKEAQARATYYGFRREAQIALGGQGGQGGLYASERRLREQMGLQIVDPQLLRPVDDVVTARFVFDYDALTARAMSERTELRRQSIRLQQQQLRLVAAKNFLLPQLDLVGRYRLRGFGDDLTGSGPRFSSAYDDFLSFDHQEWEFGVEMGVVAGRRQARAAVHHSALQVKRERAILEQQQHSLQLEIGDAVAEVASSYAAMESSQAQVAAAKQRLDASEALYAADKIQIEFLLDAQEGLLRAEVQLATDQTRYSLSLVNVNNAAGSLLDDLGIHISKGCSANYLHYQLIPPAAPTETEILEDPIPEV